MSTLVMGTFCSISFHFIPLYISWLVCLFSGPLSSGVGPVTVMTKLFTCQIPFSSFSKSSKTLHLLFFNVIMVQTAVISTYTKELSFLDRSTEIGVSDRFVSGNFNVDEYFHQIHDLCTYFFN